MNYDIIGPWISHDLFAWSLLVNRYSIIIKSSFNLCSCILSHRFSFYIYNNYHQWRTLVAPNIFYFLFFLWYYLEVFSKKKTLVQHMKQSAINHDHQVQSQEACKTTSSPSIGNTLLRISLNLHRKQVSNINYISSPFWQSSPLNLLFKFP